MDTTAHVTTGKRIRDYRHRRGLSIAELARRSELTESTIYRLEAEERKPRSDTLQALASALDVTTDELLGLEPLPAVSVEDGRPRTVNLPLLTSDSGEADSMEVPIYALPEGIDQERLVAVVPDEGAPALQPDDLVIAACDHDWRDGDLLVARLDGRIVVRRGYREAADASVLL